MPSPSVFKSSTFLYGTTGTVGAAGVAFTGWQFLGSGKGIPDASALGLDSSSTKAEIDGSYDCFSNYFEGVKFPESSGEGALDNLDPLTNVQPSKEQSETNPMGCMIMQLSYDFHDTKNPKWVFKGEITIQSGNIGWALWLAGYGGKSENNGLQYNQQMDHKLVFLEKNNEGTWEIKTGLGWSDWGSASNFSVHVAEPDGNVWIDKYVTKDENEDFVGLSSDTKSSFHSYSGEWKVQKNGKEVFGDVNIVKKNYDGGNVAIFLGKEDGFGSDISVEYIYDGGKWKQLDDSADPGEVTKEYLNKWYEPFKGKKGNWSKLK